MGAVATEREREMSRHAGINMHSLNDARANESREEVAKEEITEGREGTHGGRVASAKEARRGREGERERRREERHSLSSAILVIATRVLLHSPLNNAAARARTRHARATVCACESRGVSRYLRILTEWEFHTLPRIARAGGSIIQGTREEIELYLASSLLCAAGCAPISFFFSINKRLARRNVI